MQAFRTWPKSRTHVLARSFADLRNRRGRVAEGQGLSAYNGAMIESALEVQNLTMSYGDKTVVDDVSFSVARGTIAAILGPNGAGKTTTIESCEGLRTPVSGTISLLGLDRVAGDAEIRRRVGVMLQDGGLPQAPTAAAVLSHISKLHRNSRDVRELLDLLELTEHSKTKVRHLSGGQRQRLSLACALVGNPDLVFLDEPSAGMDPASRRTLHGMIRNLAASGTTVVLTTHLMDEAETLADQVIVMRDGTIIADGPASELLGGRSMWIEGAHAETLRQILSPDLPGYEFLGRGDQLEIFGKNPATPGDLAKVAAALDRHAINTVSVSLRPRSLEDLYFDLVEVQ